MALRSKEQHTVIIKTRTRKNHSHASHGGWKVAYADFVTAMMAFFLLMWLQSSTNAEEQEELRKYFNPYQAEQQEETDPTAGIISIMDGGKLGDGNAQESQVFDNLIAMDAAEATESANPLDHWDTVELSREEYDDLIRMAGDNYLNQRELPKTDEMTDLRHELENLRDSNPWLQKYADQILIEDVKEGLRIQFIDTDAFAMFELGSSKLNPAARSVISELGASLKNVKQPIAITGHTDGRPFASAAKFSNWDLSSERANEARRVLQAAGVTLSQIDRVEGKADRDLLLPDQPNDARNRRISFLILR
jgi:chemotaxis protein MotB